MTPSQAEIDLELGRSCIAGDIERASARLKAHCREHVLVERDWSYYSDRIWEATTQAVRSAQEEGDRAEAVDSLYEVMLEGHSWARGMEHRLTQLGLQRFALGALAGAAVGLIVRWLSER